MLEQSIAAQAAEKDPKLALKVARESLKKGVSPNVLDLLRRLQQEDSDAATQLAADIVRKVGSGDFAVNQRQQLRLQNFFAQSYGQIKVISLDRSVTPR